MANFNLNTVILGGRLVATPEIKQTATGVPVCSFSLAVNRKYSQGNEQQTDFINCTAWRSTAEFIGKYFKKGSAICIRGSIQTRSWNDNNGNKRTATEVIVDEAMFVDGKNEGPGVETASPNAYFPDAYKPNSAPADMAHDDDLPF